jgi:hypothetical protein
MIRLISSLAYSGVSETVRPRALTLQSCGEILVQGVSRRANALVSPLSSKRSGALKPI